MSPSLTSILVARHPSRSHRNSRHQASRSLFCLDTPRIILHRRSRARPSFGCRGAALPSNTKAIKLTVTAGTAPQGTAFQTAHQEFRPVTRSGVMPRHFTTLILIAMVLGIVVGYACHEAFPDAKTAAGIAGFAIATSRDIEVKAKPDTAGGVSGMLLRYGDTFGIAYATHIPSEGFQRFSVGHELGHYFLDGHIDHVLPKDGVHTSYAGFVSADPYELEADQFAAVLLMPSAPFKHAIARQDPGLEVVESLASLGKAS